MLDFGALYLTGIGVEKNREQALVYYKMALDNNDIKAYRCLGNYYLYDNTDEGIPVRTTDMERVKKAYEYFKEGAEQCEVNCLYELGDLYLRGEVVDKDEKMAFSLYSRAFECFSEEKYDDSEADINLRLGEAYYRGLGTEPDYLSAIEHLQTAFDLFRYRAGNGDMYAVTYVDRAYNEWKNVLHELVTEMMEVDFND